MIDRLNKRLELEKVESKELDHIDFDFLELWAIYPRKQGKGPASRTYRQLRKTYTKEQLEEATMKYLLECSNKEKQYIKQGGGFFAERIIDYIGEQVTKVIDYKADVDLYTQMLNALKYMPYNEYLTTEHWLHFKDEVLKFYRYSCQVCNSKSHLNVHHKTYENRGRETFNDVILICSECHEKIHGKHGGDL